MSISHFVFGGAVYIYFFWTFSVRVLDYIQLNFGMDNVCVYTHTLFISSLYSRNIKERQIENVERQIENVVVQVFQIIVIITVIVIIIPFFLRPFFLSKDLYKGKQVFNKNQRRILIILKVIMQLIYHFVNNEVNLSASSKLVVQGLLRIFLQGFVNFQQIGQFNMENKVAFFSQFFSVVIILFGFLFDYMYCIKVGSD
eukprot:TRINITY_DN6830_c0_g1_i12.p3 TRINITY_DN6830_c0_g1~~TRINITY_DN6830_c0_g1_i12.p3  ORF type:complete len:199 (+),score=1.02 TRINITY_DN6830_c0_g1_i12:284-880(+)